MFVSAAQHSTDLGTNAFGLPRSFGCGCAALSQGSAPEMSACYMISRLVPTGRSKQNTDLPFLRHQVPLTSLSLSPTSLNAVVC